MNSEETDANHDLSSLDILLFTVDEVLCGMDGGLIGRMLLLDEAVDSKVQLRWFHQALSFGERPVFYQNPWVVTMKGVAEVSGLVIDQPLDLVKLSPRAICPMPAFFALTEGLRVYWGAFMFNERVVLLIDPYQLLA